MLIYEELIDENRIKMRTLSHGCTFTEQLGIVELGKHDILNQSSK